MGALEEIRRMQQEGRNEAEIIQNLHLMGLPDEEISEALSQSRIKEAVNADSPVDMQPSMMGPEGQPPQEPQAPQPYSPAYPAYDSQQEQPLADYSQQQYQGGFSPDTITEIAEQVIQEKLADAQNKFHAIAAFKASVEAKIESVDDRLKKLEKIIDRLQLSILQKVGDYVTNVEDIKKELVETQKSFKTLLDKHKK